MDHSNITGQNPGGAGSTINFPDSIYAIAQEMYFWNNALPSYDQFNPQRFTGDGIDPLNQEVTAIKSYSPLDTKNNLHYDHFSAILTEKDYQDLFVTGSSMGYGMKLPVDLNGNVRVSYVAKQSPAYKQGVRRGWQLLSLNGVNTINPTKSTLDALNKDINAMSTNFVFQNTEGKQVSLTLNQTPITDDEVSADTVLTEGSKKVGYIVYNTFLTTSPQNQQATHPELNAAFSKFSQAGITDIIIDLRYNGGGYTDIADQMANALVPAAYDNTLMYTVHYNDSLNNQYNATKIESIPHDQVIKFNKKDPNNPSNLNVNNVVFIVSSETASAAELLINNLSPIFPNVKLVGLGLGKADGIDQRTAGKPFGFADMFALPNETNPVYRLLLINSEFKNSKNEDNYVSGFTPDVQTYDGIAYNWGDPNEDGLKMALGYVVNGTFPAVQSEKQLAIAREKTRIPFGSPLSITPTKPRFVGMITHSFGDSKKNMFQTSLKAIKKGTINKAVK